MIDFTMPHNELGHFYEQTITRYNISNIILFGDCRPIHKPIFPIALKHGITVHVFEEGYTRPNHITFEESGINDRSPMPRTLKDIKARAKELRQNDISPLTHATPILPNPIGPRVRWDLMFHLANILSMYKFRNYQSHRPERVRDEAKGWINRFIRKLRFNQKNEATLARYKGNTPQFFFIPLQLNSDFQIREHSDYDGVPTFIRETIYSFAKHSPPEVRLLIKSHPLDNGMIDYREIIAECADACGVNDRVDFIIGGDLDSILERAQGVVLINSTVGYAALKAGVPVKVMGRAIYDMDGLTNQKPLDAFWKAPGIPVQENIIDFLSVVKADSQLYGDFFTGTGMNCAAKAAAKKLMQKD